MSIHPYALMMNDPTSEVMLCWIDRRTGATSAPQTLRYGPSNIEVVSNVVTLPGGTRFIHNVHLTGLSPGLCPVSLPIEGFVFPPVKILPKTMPLEGLVGLQVSDMHCGTRQINTPALFNHIGSERPDFILMAGDSSGELDFGESAGNTDIHVNSFRQYFSQWWADGAFLPQMICDAGNHWVGNSNGNGTSITGAVTGAGYYDWFHPNAKLMAPAGVRHMVTKIGDWLQIISGDVYSNTVANARAVFAANHDPDMPLCIFMAHSPMFSQGNRLSNDPTIQRLMREQMFKRLAEAENCRFSFGGNIHLDTVTKPLAFFPTDPEGVRIPVAGPTPGFIAPAPEGEWRTIIELGEGCIGGRSLLEAPVVPSEFYDRMERHGLNYYLMHFKPGRVVVECKNAEGLQLARTFDLPDRKTAAGAYAISRSRTGAPIYRRRRA